MLWTAMPLFAATTIEKLQQVPPHTWWMITLTIVGFIVLVLLIRFAAQMSKLLLCGIVLFLFFLLCTQWVYERDEPAWATPIVEPLAQFLPSKGKPTPPKPPSGQPR